MKKTASMILVLILCLSLFSASALAADPITDEVYNSLAIASKETFKDASDDDLTGNLLMTLVELSRRGVITKERMNDVYAVFKDGPGVFTTTRSLNETEYNFGQGIYYVGTDLQAGSYDILCTAVEDEDLGDTMDYLGDLYGSLGMGGFDSYFDSLGGLVDTVTEMYVCIYTANGNLDNMYTLKNGQTVRAVVADGMRIEISDGSARLTFIR